MFDFLDYIYVPAADVNGEATRYVEVLDAELVWKVREREPPWPVCGSVTLGQPSCSRVTAGHGAVLVYQMQDYAATCRSCQRETSPYTNWRFRTARVQRSRWRRRSGTRSTNSCGPTRFTCSTAVSTRECECAAVTPTALTAGARTTSDHPSAGTRSSHRLGYLWILPLLRSRVRILPLVSGYGAQRHPQ